MEGGRGIYKCYSRERKNLAHRLLYRSKIYGMDRCRYRVFKDWVYDKTSPQIMIEEAFSF